MITYSGLPKRAIDLVLSMVGLCLTAPIIACVAAAIRIRLGAPVLFRQQRPGLNGVPFELVKFRSMRDVRSADGEVLSDGMRLEPLGRFLRATSLDELPELWNVVRGDMSIVGPRPLLMRYLPRYSPTQRRRHEMRPGITGLAQVAGRNELPWEEKFDLDVQYIDSCSFWVDLKIMAATVAAVVRRQGINRQGHATAPEFMGSEGGR